RLLEVERLAELDARHRRQPQQMVVDDRGQLLTHVLEARELERVDHGQPLGQHLVAYLRGHPRREVVAVGGGDRAMAQEVAVRVIEDGAGGHLLQPLEQLALVGGAMVERLAQLHAAGEDEGLGRGEGHRGSEPSRATGKWASTSPSGRASSRASSGSPVNASTKRTPRSTGTTRVVSSQYSRPSGGASRPRRARRRGTTVRAAPSAPTRAKAQRCSASAPRASSAR